MSAGSAAARDCPLCSVWAGPGSARLGGAGSPGSGHPPFSSLPGCWRLGPAAGGLRPGRRGPGASALQLPGALGRGQGRAGEGALTASQSVPSPDRAGPGRVRCFPGLEPSLPRGELPAQPWVPFLERMGENALVRVKLRKTVSFGNLGWFDRFSPAAGPGRAAWRATAAPAQCFPSETHQGLALPAKRLVARG